jgi:hypothetical protein
VKYRVEYCRYVTSVANVTAYIQKEWDDAKTYVKEWSNSFGKSEEDCSEWNPDVIGSFWLDLPNLPREGTYRLSFVLNYYINSLREPVELVVNTEWFGVEWVE